VGQGAVEVARRFEGDPGGRGQAAEESDQAVIVLDMIGHSDLLAHTSIPATSTAWKVFPMSIAPSQVWVSGSCSQTSWCPPRLQICGPKDAATPAAAPHSAGTTAPSSPRGCWIIGPTGSMSRSSSVGLASVIRSSRLSTAHCDASVGRPAGRVFSRRSIYPGQRPARIRAGLVDQIRGGLPCSPRAQTIGAERGCQPKVPGGSFARR
jgi:hypothetical protein